MVEYNKEEELTGDGKRKGGCYLSTLTGLILSFLAVFLAVAVGIIVYFARTERACNCVFPIKNFSENIGASVQSCQNLITKGGSEICSVCTGNSTPTLVDIKTAPPSALDFRLPRSLSPELYTVELQPNMYNGPPEHFTFNGSVKIRMLCHESTQNITLHINKLNITGEIIISAVTPSDTIGYKGHLYDEKLQFLLVQTNKPMVPGNVYEIYLTFVGPLKDDRVGLYLSSYKRNNDTVYLAASHFSAANLRKVFPCFDEPAMKAKFNVTLVRKSHMVSLSNMPRTSSTARGNGWIADNFKTTPVMSTYLLAFIVCDFNHTEGMTKNNVQLFWTVAYSGICGRNFPLIDLLPAARVALQQCWALVLDLNPKDKAWSRPEVVNQTKYALEVGITILTYFEDYFNISYPLPKLDMIAVPQLAATAMENWGLITFRETTMLYDKKESSESTKQRVAYLVSHELAHKWFGNLVTPSWWADIWLNEGFACLFDIIGVDFVHPDWKMFEQFVVKDLQNVFNIDGLVTSHPIYSTVSTLDQINRIFDSITYSKGSSIIRMMRFFLGEETFRKGLTIYLKRNAYGTAHHDDLYFALSNQSSAEGKYINVKQIMDTWTLQMNYPVINVTTSGEVIKIQQKRYLGDYKATDPGKFKSPFNYTWEVPFTFTTKSDQNFNQTEGDIYWMHKTKEETIHYNVAPSDWIIGNVMQYGYYRVTYSDDNWEKLITQLKSNHEIIHPINRAQIINDAWNLAKSGDLDMQIAIKTVNYLRKEKNYVPWKAALKELIFLDSMLQRTGLYGLFSKFMKYIVGEIFNTSLNNRNLTHLQSYVITLTAAEACKYGIQQCIDESVRLFNQWKLSPVANSINPSVRSTVYCTAIKNGGVEEWDFAYRMYQECSEETEKYRLMSSLACSSEVWILNRYLKYSLNPSKIRKQDATNVIRSVSINVVGRALAWDFVRGHWTELLHYLGNTSRAGSMIKRILGTYNTRNDLLQLENFISSTPNLGSVSRALQQAVEKANDNIRWMDKNYKVVEEWLMEFNFL